MDDSIKRINRLFLEKLRALYPGHPWLGTEEARAALDRQDAMSWKEPRRVDRWFWMDVEFMEGDRMVRYGRVSWEADGTGYYGVSITYQKEGIAFYCWPSFRVLSDAQDFVECLMGMSVERARAIHAIHGQQWPNVVL